jgi:hypothetical protein
MRQHGLRLLATLGVALVVVPAATASELIDRNATGVTLSVNVKGEALLNYRVGGKARHVLAWGAVNAIAPTKARKQVEFKLDYAGGWGKYRRQYWKTFGNACGAYDGPPLAWQKITCKAPDGSYWAVQAWQRMLPNLGLDPTPAQAVWELRLSHWTGALPELTIETDWAYRRYDHLFGTFTYGGTGVFGFKSTPAGVPLDTFGRNIYLDTFDSAYGDGWKRENSFLTHTGTAVFCYGVFPHQNNSTRPAGKGAKYRATAIGPGVTPDVTWEGTEPGSYSRDADATKNAAIKALGDPQCQAN